MKCKLFTAVAGLVAAVLAAGVGFSPASQASQRAGAHERHNQAPGITVQSIDKARQATEPDAFVRMAPQSSATLLSRATRVGPHAPKATVRLTLGLTLNHVAKLKSFLEQVQNPHSDVYHQWLTPREFTANYGPNASDVAAVVKFLETQNIAVTDISANRMLIHTRATTRAYENAFGIQINDYKLDGRRFYSTADSPRLPRALAPLVANVLGLDHGRQLHPHSYFGVPGAAVRDLDAHQAPAPSLTNLNPLQIATAYNVPDITDGSHGADVGIAIVTANSPDVAGNRNYSDFWSAFGLPDHEINVINVGGSPDPGGQGETTLDIEYSGAMGPGATLNVYVAANAQFDTFTDAYNQSVVDNISEVMSTSWGLYESGSGGSLIETDEQIFMEGAAQGMTMFAAAGDDGASDGGPGNNNADYPSSSAYVTAANGTQLTISDRDGHYGSEAVWNDSNCFNNGRQATGGAISDFIDKPAWQRGPGVPGDIDTRMNSDVALTASCSRPMLVYGGQWGLTAGTSAVAPQLAGIFAIGVAQNGERLGQSNTLIYDDVDAGNYALDFQDVTEGCNGELPDGSDSCAGENWDHPSGWGSLNVKNFLQNIGIQGPKGTLAGTVTDAASGATLAGAMVAAVASDGEEYDAEVADDGSYSRLLPAGDYLVTVTDFGYADSSASVTIADGDEISRDFALSAASNATLSGKVSDDSGHGYGLYADVKVSEAGFGQVAETWTDPATGIYSVDLPEGATYTVDVAAAFEGYHGKSATVDLSGGASEDFALSVVSACVAPGYALDEDSGDCQPLDGGLVYGQVKDASTGDGIVDATVSDDTGASTTTVDVPDPDAPDGLYLYFADASVKTLTASKAEFSVEQAAVTVAEDGIIEQDFALKHPAFAADPHDVMVNVKVGAAATASFALSNTGEGAGAFKILSMNGPAPVPGTHSNSAPLMRVPLKHPEWMRASLAWVRAQLQAEGKSFMMRPAAKPLPQDTAGWQSIADYPQEISDNFGARDSKTGTVYAVSGFGESGPETGAMAYDSETDSWSPIADVPTVHMLGAAAFMNGKLYVVGGWDETPAGNPAAELDIYDPKTDSWSTGEPDPVGQGGGVSHATLGGKLYLVGGCADGNCGTILTAVEAYDPATDSWSAAADYPEPVAHAACGGIEGKLYCAGALGTAVSGAGYVYDPATDEWAPIANMATPQAAGFYTAANGLLVVAGGIDGGSDVTNATEAYNPSSDSWDTSLPNLNTAVARGASACGMYQVGGIAQFSPFGPIATTESSVLPGYDKRCGASSVRWLTVAPPTGTVDAGASAHVVLTFDGSKQKEYTQSEAYLKIKGAPKTVILPITVNWKPQPVDLKVSGNVSPTGTVEAGDSLAYEVTVRNLANAGGAAQQTRLVYELPENVNYQAASGAICAPSARSSVHATAGLVGAAITASVTGPASITCDLGTLEPGEGKLVTITVDAMVAADSVSAIFKASAREPDSNPDNNTLTLDTNPNAGSPGPEGPKGPKGDKGSGGFGWLALMLLAGLGVAVLIRRWRSSVLVPSGTGIYDTLSSGTPPRVDRDRSRRVQSPRSTKR